MDVKEEVKTEENKINENSMTDLPVADEQSDSTKGGAGGRREAAIGLIVGGAAGAGSL